MLVLSRKVSERIQIGPDVTITIVRIRRDKVQVGIDAPRDLAVDRQEILVRKRTNAPMRKVAR